MIIDDRDELRKTLLNFATKPSNADVIYYDNKFIDLINVDVDKLYNDELDLYSKLQKKYAIIKDEVDEYNARVENLKLLGKNMSEADYIEKIRTLEIEYAKKYKAIKILESKINTLSGKILDLQNKIEIQIAKEIQAKRNKKNEMLENKRKLSNETSTLRIILKNRNKVLDILKDKLNFERERYNTFEKNKKSIHEEKYRCDYCKCVINKKRSESLLNYIDTQQNSLLNKIDKLKKDIEEEEEETNKVNKKLSDDLAQLKNIKSVEQQNIFAYEKKSVQVLRLEGKIFGIQEEIEKLKEEYNEKTKRAGAAFKDLKLKIESYKESLFNLHELKESRENLKVDLDIYKDIIEQVKTIKESLNFHCQFLITRNKLWEQKISNLFDNKIRVQLFTEENMIIKEECKVYYNNIELMYLRPDEEKIVENMIVDKMKLLDDI